MNLSEEKPEPADEETTSPYDLRIETLSGDLRDAMLTRFRDVNTAWSAMSEDKQRDFCNGIEQAARDLVRQTVRLISAHDFPKCVVMLGEVKIIGGDKARIEAKISAANIGENRDVLGEHVSQWAVLYCVDSDTFMGEAAPAKVDADQPELPMAGDDVEDSILPSGMIRRAKDAILSEKQTTSAFLQARLVIGFNKAARILEQLEAEGFLSKPDENGVRSIIGTDDSQEDAA